MDTGTIILIVILVIVAIGVIWFDTPSEISEEKSRELVELVHELQPDCLVNGRVGEAVIRKSSGYAVLDQSAIRAVKTWKFEPAKKSGIPYKTWAELPVKFVISSHNS